MDEFFLLGLRDRFGELLKTGERRKSIVDGIIFRAGRLEAKFASAVLGIQSPKIAEKPVHRSKSCF